MEVYKRKNPEPPKCMYNDGVVCWTKEKTCSKCGWCPEVEANRNQKLKERMGKA